MVSAAGVSVASTVVMSSANAGVPTAASVNAVVAAKFLILFHIYFPVLLLELGLTAKSNLDIGSISSDLITYFYQYTKSLLTIISIEI
ncbi:TPA: hypothetical protein U1C24_002087, partial [Streptococcus suis]|nr:hypothetical protein [Streptococcus suis]